MSTQEYSIKALEMISGVKAHTIRIWEQRHEAFKPARTATNIRCYSDSDLKKLLNYNILLHHGFKISQLVAMSEEELNERVNATFAPHEHDSVIDNLVIDMIGFDRESFENKLNKLILNLGFEEAVNQVIYPFFTKVGLLWQTSHINPAQEHFVSNIIRQKFFSAIDTPYQKSPNPKKILLFLPENELHELGLPYSFYLIRKAGHDGVYLGQDTPTRDLITTWSSTKPDYLLTHFTIRVPQDDLQQYLLEIDELINPTPLIVMGKPAEFMADNQLKGIHYLATPSELKHILTR